MIVLDPGHKYLLDSFDGGEPLLLTFVKRDSPSEKFPGNVGHYPGTQTQEVLRALINRGLYVQNQQPCAETAGLIDLLRVGLWSLEARTRRVREQLALDVVLSSIEDIPTCSRCGHIACLIH